MSGLCISFEEDLMKLSDGFNTDVCRFKGVALPSVGGLGLVGNIATIIVLRYSFMEILFCIFTT